MPFDSTELHHKPLLDLLLPNLAREGPQMSREDERSTHSAMRPKGQLSSLDPFAMTDAFQFHGGAPQTLA